MTAMNVHLDREYEVQLSVPEHIHLSNLYPMYRTTTTALAHAATMFADAGDEEGTFYVTREGAILSQFEVEDPIDNNSNNSNNSNYNTVPGVLKVEYTVHAKGVAVRGIRQDT